MHIEIRPYLSEDHLDALTDLIHRAYAPHLALGLRYWATDQPSSDTEKRLLSGMGLIMLASSRGNMRPNTAAVATRAFSVS